MTKDILQQFDEKYQEWEAEIMEQIYELIEINFGATMVADATQIIPIKKDIKSFLEESLNTQKKEIKEMIGNIELDKKAHSKGGCSFKSMAVCSAEEQEIKMSLLKAIDKL